MASRSELLAEALRRGLIKREDLESEAKRRNLSVYAPEQREQYIGERAQQELSQFGRELTSSERFTRGAIKYGAPAIGGIAAQLVAPAAPVVAGAIGVAGGAAEGELQLQRYDIRHGLRKAPVSLTESLKAGGEAGAEALITGGLMKGISRGLGAQGAIPPEGSRQLEKMSFFGIRAAAVRPKPITEKRLYYNIRKLVGSQRSNLTPEKIRMNQIVAEAGETRVNPEPVIDALLKGPTAVTELERRGLRDASKTAQNIINEVDESGTISLSRFNEIEQELSSLVSSKLGALKVRGSDQRHISAYNEARNLLHQNIPSQYKEEFGELAAEVAAKNKARKYVQSKVGLPTNPKFGASEWVKNVVNDVEEMDWLRKFDPQIAKDVEYLSTRRLLKPDERRRVHEIMGMIRTGLLPVTRSMAKTASILVRPSTTLGGVYKPLKRVGLYKGVEEK